MENISIFEAKDHLEDLFARAARGEDVRIADPKSGVMKLTPVAAVDVVALRKPRELGFLNGVLPPPPEDFFDPMTDEELKLWYGDDE